MEQGTSDVGPSGSQIEPSTKKAKVEETQEDPYYVSDLTIGKGRQLLSIKTEPEEADEYEEEYDDEVSIEYKKEECIENEYEEELSDVQRAEEEIEERKEITIENSGILNTSSVSNPSLLSTSKNIPPSSTVSASLLWLPNPPAFLPNFPFSGNSGLIKVPLGNEPHDFFNLLFTGELFQLLAQETNAYAEELCIRQGSNPQSRISRWKVTSADEMKIFIGLLFCMGNVKVDKTADYWSLNENLDFQYFKKRMTKDRWLILKQTFHLARNPIVDHPIPKNPVFEIRPLLDLFHKNMKEVQLVGKNVCIGESTFTWKGQILTKDNVPLRNCKYGLKLYMLAEPDGLIYRFLIYAGSIEKELCGLENGKKIALKLMTGLLGAGRSVFLDDYYTSVDLATELLNQQTYITGTLLPSRKNNPNGLIAASLKKGEVVQCWLPSGVNVSKWKDKNDVLTISTEFSGELVNISQRRFAAKKPKVVLEFHRNIRGIDRINQSVAYIAPRKTVRWYKKLSFHIFELMLFNCYVLYRRSEGTRQLDFHDFRLAIVDYLCGPLPPASPPLTPSAKIINRTHFPSFTDIPEGRGRRRQLVCRSCYKREVRTKTTTYCPGCPEKPGLCIGDCFLNYHQDKGFDLI